MQAPWCSLPISGASLAGGALSLERSLQAEELTVGDKILLTVNTQSGVSGLDRARRPRHGHGQPGGPAEHGAQQRSLANVSNVTFNATEAVQHQRLQQPSTLSVISTQFVDVDGSGSDFYISFGSSGASNAFYSAVQYGFFSLAAARPRAAWRGPAVRASAASTSRW
ncbi:MAG: hypothetical protein R3F46_00245 [bacterium]